MSGPTNNFVSDPLTRVTHSQGITRNSSVTIKSRLLESAVMAAKRL